MLGGKRKHNIYIIVRENFSKSRNMTSLIKQTKKESETSFIRQRELNIVRSYSNSLQKNLWKTINLSYYRDTF